MAFVHFGGVKEDMREVCSGYRANRFCEMIFFVSEYRGGEMRGTNLSFIGPLSLKTHIRDFPGLGHL